ncbi:hypothetical protein E3P91_02093 [Wallemia ichthyophaga]|nr:hypothetical protein E3P91_02093 [Wallemia ichthyophaga]
MAQDDEIDLSSIFWRAPEFLQFYGNTLNDVLIMDYFSLSPFYDKKSNNQLIKMQNIANLAQPMNLQHQLVHFVGVEFVLADSKPPDLFIIKKQYRYSPSSVRVLGVYYCLNNNIYAAPDGYSTLGIKFHSAIFALQSSMKSIRDVLPAYNPRIGYKWDIQDKQRDKLDESEDNPLPLLRSMRSTREDVKAERERRAKVLGEQSEQEGEQVGEQQQVVVEPPTQPIPTKAANSTANTSIKKKKRKSTKSTATSRSSTPATPATPVL